MPGLPSSLLPLEEATKKEALEYAEDPVILIYIYKSETG
jgi:hypothetical protein